MLRRLKSFGLPSKELINIYKTFILPKLTYASPAWSSSLNLTQKKMLEKVQKRALKISLGTSYTTYEHALTAANLTKLEVYHNLMLREFGDKILSSERHRRLLPATLPTPHYPTRHANSITPSRPDTERYKNSPIVTIVRMLNT